MLVPMITIGLFYFLKQRPFQTWKFLAIDLKLKVLENKQVNYANAMLVTISMLFDYRYWI